MRTDYDLVIIGGGMVGASLACSLGGSALRVAVVETFPFDSLTQPSYDERTVTLAYGSKRIFEGMDIWRNIEAQGVSPIKRIHISDRGHLGITRLDAAKLGVEALGYVVETRRLGAALNQTMRGHANIDLLCPASLENVMFHADAVTATIKQIGKHLSNEKVGTHLPNEKEEKKIELRARLLVGADGARSRVRELTGIRAQQVDYRQTAIVTTVTPEYPHQQVAYERFTPSGPLAVLPMSGNRCAAVWSVRRHEVDELLGLKNEDFCQQLQTQFGERLGKLQNPGKRQAFPLNLTYVRAPVRPRLVLIGNAAHALHPVAAQGLNLGLRDAATLAQLVAYAAQAQNDIGRLALLRQYADWRKRDHVAMTGFTNGLVRIFSNTFLPMVITRNLGLLALDLLPPVKRVLVRRTMGLAGRLPRLARGLPL